MDLTALLAKVIGPVLLLRAPSIAIDRKHFVALLMGCITLAVVHSDTSSPAALLIHAVAWGGIVKASALILCPRLVAAKARLLEQYGILAVVFVVCFLVGGYFTWFGDFGS